jgi:hypothetical protein
VKTLVIAGGALIAIVALAFAMQAVSHRIWERRVWKCYAALGNGGTPLNDRFAVPPACRTAKIEVTDLGTPNAAIWLFFPPSATMWMSYALRTAGYDTYSIAVRRRDGSLRAEIHHGSD